MDQHGSNVLASALFGDNRAMLDAVASLLSKHQGTKEQDTTSLTSSPLLVLTNMPGKDSLLANVILGTSQCKPGSSKSDVSLSNEALLPSFEEVHALATANLVASTQRDIAKQLAEASNSAPEPGRQKAQEKRDKKQDAKDSSKKEKPECFRKIEIKKTPSKSNGQDRASPLPDIKATQHQDPKALICSFEGCGRKFAWLNHLKYHELTHTNNRQFKCSVETCGKTFYTAQRLSVHQRTHTGERPFKCTHQDCGKTFATAGNLKNHQRIHTGEQPYVCDHLNCNRRFTEQSSLRKHKLTHSGDKPFGCKICGKKFTQSGSRQQHLIRHHLDDEIRNSFKQERSEKDADDDEAVDSERKELSGQSTATLKKETGTVDALSCSPQVLVLNNAYPGLPTSESIVFSHGLSDHIVTVKAQSVEHRMADSEGLSLQHTLLSSDGLNEGTLHGKSDDLVVLSEASMYQHDENPGDIVYAADILDHEEVAHADYAGAHVDYSGEITHTVSYPSHGEIPGGDDFTHHSETYTTHGGDMTVTEYVPTECIQQVSNYTDSKELPPAYLDAERDVVHAEFIGAEEIAVAQYPNVSSSSDLSVERTVHIENTQIIVSSTNSALSSFNSLTEKWSQDKDTSTKSVYSSNPSNSTDLDYMPTRSEVCCSSNSAMVTEVACPAAHTHCPTDRGIHMDPMMECDEEPEKHQLTAAT